MAEILGLFGGWTWWIIGAVLLVGELLATSIFMVWLGLAALSVGLADVFLDLNWQTEVILFVVLSVAYVLIGRRYTRTRSTDEDDQPYLNQRMNAFVGRTAVLHEAIENGEGKVRIDDALWRVTGTDAPVGSRVLITGGSGMVLETEPA
jgi:membrane protein implicated in regulation of membrane protease activity